MIIHLVLLLCAVSALAAPANIPILKMEQTNDAKGNFNVEYKAADGTVFREKGQLKDLGAPGGPVQVKDGSYEFLAPNGKTYSVKWVADEKGFHAEGEHLPTSPPIPPEILKSLLTNPKAPYAAQLRTPKK